MTKGPDDLKFKISGLKKAFFIFLIIFLSIYVLIITSELILETMDYQIIDYWTPFYHTHREPAFHEFDPVLGWRPYSGEFTVPPYVPWGKEVKIVIWPNLARATSPQQIEKGEEFLFIGGSLTQGWAISDEETFAWQLQKRFPNKKMVNRGTVGYGTYQSLLVLKDYLNDAENLPSKVVYGFIDHHENRNVADVDWLLILSRAARRGHVSLPYCLTAKSGGLKCFPPESYPRWPIDRSSYLANFLKDQYIQFKFRDRLKQARDVTEQLLLEMDALTKEKGTELYVVLLWFAEEPKEHYINFLKDKNIKFVDCEDPRKVYDILRVEGEGHPNWRMHWLWADCIEKGLRELDF